MFQQPWKIQKYTNEQGIKPFDRWLSTLDNMSQVRVDVRLKRVAAGNFGDRKFIGEGVYELRLFFGAGYRIYYALADERVVLLLAGGDKKSQSRDITKAKNHWSQYRLNSE